LFWIGKGCWVLAAGLVVAITSSHYLWHCNLLDNSVPFAFSIINNYVEKFSVNGGSLTIHLFICELNNTF
jgi:hypothetical protein